LDGHSLEHPVDDRFRFQPFGLPVKVEQNAMSQSRPGERLNIRDGNVVPSLQQGPDLGAGDKRL
jgi:hypothetical protein